MNESFNTEISILIPTITDSIPKVTIQSILNTEFTNYEIIILHNDVFKLLNGLDCQEISKNSDFIREFKIRKKGKGNALNIGIQHAKYDFICVLDEDCILQANALHTAMKHFIDENVVAVGGRIVVLDKDFSILEQVQKCEYRNTFQLSRSIFAALNGQCLISGAFGIFRKSALVEIGGYDIDTVGEDMEIILRLQDAGNSRNLNKIVYDKETICFTKVPCSFNRLFHQRERWQRGLKDSLIKHKNMIGNPMYGTLGFSLLYQFIFELYGPILLPILSIFILSILKINLLIFLFMHITVNYMFNVVAVYFEDKRMKSVIHKLPRLLLITVLLALLQIPLNVVRIYGMLFFKKRRIIW